MIEVADYACSHCRDFNRDKASLLDAQYVKTGKVRWIGHVFALRPETQPAAAAALCANEQGKYWEFHRQAFLGQLQDRYPNNDDFLSWGQKAGLDTNQFAECVNSGRTLQDAQVSALEASRAGVDGTPTFFINGTVIYGDVSLAQFQSAIEAALAGKP
jgi:protein-disulfide isomerase